VSVRYDRSMRARQPVGRPPFHPRQLFAGADLGFVHDPRVAGALFEESTGITPITSAGRPNGLLLDDRFRQALGPESVANGDAASGMANWTELNSICSTSLNTFSVTAPSNFGAIRQNINRTGLSLYLVCFEVLSASSLNQGVINLTDSFGSIDSATSSLRFNVGNHCLRVFMHGVSLVQMRVAGAGQTVVFDNISIRAILGSPALQASPPSRPIFQPSPARVVFDGMDDSHTTPFPSSLGGACTVARAIPGVGAQILTGQTIGTAFTNTTTHAGLVVINRALTPSETANLTSWLNKAAGL
jgi:hypothetical protein